ncbi:MAG TPA: T9SS type A sorting domain-containing protein [Ignavibacteriaceae bacterium]|nr:T9SS type A sorting domain-containing protein [Ignavibacteriaceae bacterium]
MKKLGLLILLFSIVNYAQPWNYNFGTSTGTYSTNGVSLTFLPDPPSGGGVDSRVRIGTAGGSFNLENQNIPFGSQTYLRIVAPISGSVNKFSIYDFDGFDLFTMRFRVRFGASDGSANGATSGTWALYIGDGAMYSDNNDFAGAQVFTGLRWRFGESGSITTEYREGSRWQSLQGSPFSQGNSYIVEIYCNNSDITESYNYVISRTVDANTFDIWVDSVLVGDDLGKALLPNLNVIDSWAFIGSSSSGNVANIFIDDIIYTNELSSDPLPVELTSFSATKIGKDIKLTWNTSTEINNFGFEIERSVFKGEWNKIGFVNGNGNSNSPKNYSFVDDKTSTGRYSYRLKQIDNDGQFEYSKVIEIDVSGVKEYELTQNYPNPFNPTTTIQYSLPQTGMVRLTLYNVLGEEIRTLVNEIKDAGTHTLNINADNLNSGIYIYRIESGSFVQSRKMTIIK